MKRLSDDWWIDLDATYRSRNANGSLVLWRPEPGGPLEGTPNKFVQAKK